MSHEMKERKAGADLTLTPGRCSKAVFNDIYIAFIAQKKKSPFKFVSRHYTEVRADHGMQDFVKGPSNFGRVVGGGLYWLVYNGVRVGGFAFV